MKILLFGETSVVGNAIAKGLLRRYPLAKVVPIGRRDLDRLPIILNAHKGEDVAVIVSIGLLSQDTAIESPEYLDQFEVNTLLTLRIIQAALNSLQVIELHFASSLLAVAPRKNYVGYHLSKLVSERIFTSLSSIAPNHVRFYTWRLPFVDSPLNRGRSTTPLVNTTPEKIEKRVSSISRPGIHYMHWMNSLLIRIYKSLSRVLIRN